MGALPKTKDGWVFIARVKAKLLLYLKNVRDKMTQITLLTDKEKPLYYYG